MLASMAESNRPHSRIDSFLRDFRPPVWIVILLTVGMLINALRSASFVSSSSEWHAALNALAAAFFLGLTVTFGRDLAHRWHQRRPRSV